MQRRLRLCLYLLGELRAHRRRGAQHFLQGRPSQPALDAGVQVEGRAHQHARCRHLVQRSCYVGRKKWLLVPDSAPAQQGQQHARFKPVHVLPGHGGHNVQALGRQALCRSPCIVVQAAPGFAVGHGRSGRAGGENNGGQVVGRNVGYRRGSRLAGGLLDASCQVHRRECVVWRVAGCIKQQR